MSNKKKVDILLEMQDISNWKLVRQKSTYSVYMCIPPLGTRVVNDIEDIEYVTTKGDVVLSGTRQETWVARLDKVIKGYVYMDGSNITQDSLKKKIKNGCIDWIQIKPRTFANSLVFHIDKKYMNVVLPNGLVANKDNKPHGKGDFLVATTLKGPITDYKVVNGEVFLDTFDMRAYPGLMSKSVTGVETTPYPIHDFCPKQDKKKNVVKEVKKEQGKPETTDFNEIGQYILSYLREKVKGYNFELIDIVSGKQLNSNYVKVVISLGSKKLFVITVKIDKNYFVNAEIHSTTLNTVIMTITIKGMCNKLIQDLGLTK